MDVRKTLEVAREQTRKLCREYSSLASDKREQRTVPMVCPYSFMNSRNRLPSTTLLHIKLLAKIRSDYPMELGCRIEWIFRGSWGLKNACSM
jgi:hypothetical protein